MTADDELPWSPPWTVGRGAPDEAAFVADVSGALYVADAAPEIRMIAEVMAVLDIPARPEQARTVAQLLQEERPQEDAKVIPLRRFAFGRRMTGVAAAAALAIGVVTVSAYAGVLPDSIQKVAHSVINAPSPKGERPKPGHSTGVPAPGGGGTRDSSGATTGAAGSFDGSSTGPGDMSAAPGAPDAATPSRSTGGAPASSAHPSNTPATGNGQTRSHSDHSSKSVAPPAEPAITQAVTQPVNAAPSPTPSGPKPHS